MAIDILNLEPTIISKDLRGKYVCIYGQPKVGKTTLASQFPKNLIAGFEHGWNAISGIYAVDITKWSDFKTMLRQLSKPEAKEKYNTITIDTIGIAWDACEQYICQQNSVQKLSDIPWGQGYTAAKKEFDSALRSITQMGYGLVIIAHVEKRVETTSDGDIEILSPAIPKRAYAIVNQLVDIIGYVDVAWDEEGNSSRWMYTRKTPTVLAGSRFKYLAPKIKFGYEELVEAISEAIEKEEKLDGAIVTNEKIQMAVEEKLDFDEVRREAKEVWDSYVVDEDTLSRAMKRIEMIFGRPMKLSEITEDQVDLFKLVVDELKELASKK